MKFILVVIVLLATLYSVQSSSDCSQHEFQCGGVCCDYENEDCDSESNYTYNGWVTSHYCVKRDTPRSPKLICEDGREPCGGRHCCTEIQQCETSSSYTYNGWVSSTYCARKPGYQYCGAVYCTPQEKCVDRITPELKRERSCEPKQ